MKSNKEVVVSSSHFKTFLKGKSRRAKSTRGAKKLFGQLCQEKIHQIIMQAHQNMQYAQKKTLSARFLDKPSQHRLPVSSSSLLM